jgi:hypothetical protein
VWYGVVLRDKLGLGIGKGEGEGFPDLWDGVLDGHVARSVALAAMPVLIARKLEAPFQRQ